MITHSAPTAVTATRSANYLPFVKGSAVEGTGSSSPLEYAQFFADTWRKLVPRLTYRDARLDEAAQMQASWLAVHDFSEIDPHIGEYDLSANERVRGCGYHLPDAWPLHSNQVESAIHIWRSEEETVGIFSARALFNLANHDTHYAHMHAQGFWYNSTVFGVGAAYARTDRGGWFFVAVTAPPE